MLREPYERADKRPMQRDGPRMRLSATNAGPNIWQEVRAMDKRIAIGCDEAAFAMKEAIKGLLEELGYEVIDKGVIMRCRYCILMWRWLFAVKLPMGMRCAAF